MFRIVIGLQCFLPPYPHTLALYQVSVRQTRCLPLTSFRFHLAMDTLVSLAIRFPLSGLVGDLHPLDNAHAEHTKRSTTLTVVLLFFHYPASKTFLTKGQKPFAGYSLENGTGPSFSQMLFTATLSAGSHLTLSSSFIANQRAASCSRSVS